MILRRAFMKILVLIISLYAYVNVYADAVNYGKIMMLKGKVDIWRGEKVLAATKRMLVTEGDEIKTASNGLCEIMFISGIAIRMEKNCTFLVSKQKSKIYQYLLKAGRIASKIFKNDSSYSIYTPVATIGVRGTIVVVEHKADTSNVVLYEGEVRVRGEKGKEVILNEGQQIEVKPASEPKEAETIDQIYRKYYDKVVKAFDRRAQEFRKQIEKIRKQKIDEIEKSKKEFEERIKKSKPGY